MLMLCLAFFAFTAIPGWDCSGERCLEYLCNGNMAAVKVFGQLCLLTVFAGPYMTAARCGT
jgi:AGCS family alanine or glycine:cation symporter